MLLVTLILFMTTSCYAQYTRPCKVDDYKCLKYYLAENSDCTRGVWGNVPDAFTSYDIRFEAPYFNASLIDQYSTTRNVNDCYVVAFFVNESSNVAVMTIECPSLEIDVFRAIIQHYPRTLDQYYYIKLTGTFPPIRFTTNLLPADSIDLCNSYTQAYITGQPKFKLTPYDEAAARYIRNVGSNFFEYENVYLREDFIHRSPAIFRTYVNSVLCNFGGCP